MAALALAEVGDMETPREALQRLARRPDATGALAASYLKQEDIRRLYDRRQKNVLDYAKKQVEGTELTGKADLKLIENVIRLIETSALGATTGGKVRIGVGATRFCSCSLALSFHITPTATIVTTISTK